MSASLYNEIVEKLKNVYDPELPVDIYSLGLIYMIKINEKTKHVDILMTLTTPNCPAAEEIPIAVKEAALEVPAIVSAEVKITFDPPYHPDRMSQEAKASLGWL